jgi:hypothetical protein
MAIQGSMLLAIVLLLLGFALRNGKASNTPPAYYDTAFLNRSSFPAGFIFGTASSSYQVLLICVFDHLLILIMKPDLIMFMCDNSV